MSLVLLLSVVVFAGEDMSKESTLISSKEARGAGSPTFFIEAKLDFKNFSCLTIRFCHRQKLKKTHFGVVAKALELSTAGRTSDHHNQQHMTTNDDG